MTESISSAFYALPAADRDAAKEAACERFGVEDFFDLDPDQRNQVYAEAVSG